MTIITMYSKDNCQWCDKARAQILNDPLNPHSLTYYTEKKLGVDFTKEELQAKLPHIEKLTLPQIWFNDTHIGGYTELVEYLVTLYKRKDHDETDV